MYARRRVSALTARAGRADAEAAGVLAALQRDAPPVLRAPRRQQRPLRAGSRSLFASERLSHHDLALEASATSQTACLRSFRVGPNRLLSSSVCISTNILIARCWPRFAKSCRTDPEVAVGASLPVLPCVRLRHAGLTRRSQTDHPMLI